MDKLETMFRMQQALDTEIAEKRNLNYTREEWVQKGVLATLSELSEVLDEVNFKWWKNPKPLDEAKLKEELVDVTHFLLSMCIHSGMDAQELFDIYVEKNRENVNRQHGTSEKKGYEVDKFGH